MIDPNNDIIKLFVGKGYRLALHAYLQADGQVNYTYVAKHPETGGIIQGWSVGRDADAALKDLERRAGLGP